MWVDIKTIQEHLIWKMATMLDSYSILENHTISIIIQEVKK